MSQQPKVQNLCCMCLCILALGQRPETDAGRERQKLLYLMMNFICYAIAMLLLTTCGVRHAQSNDGSRAGLICFLICMTLISSYSFLYLQITFLEIFGKLLTLDIPIDESFIFQFSQAFATIFAFLIIISLEYMIVQMIVFQINQLELQLRMHRGGNGRGGRNRIDRIDERYERMQRRRDATERLVRKLKPMEMSVVRGLTDCKAVDCCICLSQMDENAQVVQLACHDEHVYHYDCLLKYISTTGADHANDECPLCRETIRIRKYQQ